MKSKNAGRTTSRTHGYALRRRLLPALVAGLFLPAAHANPTGHQVVAGQASFNQQGSVLTITNTPGAIINWQQFSIGAGETTRFIQQSADSSVLNRVIGQDPSHILGTLQSNGRVFLINPNGILFGQGARIDVNGLVASTLNLSNEDFLAGRMKFEGGGAGNLKNEGSITTPNGGQVYLVAPNVENTGIITAPNGDVLLAAGRSVYLVDSANPALQVVLSAPEHEALNVGQIVVQAGRASMVGALVRQRGLVSADSALVGENGKIVFKASRDTMLEAGSLTSATGAGKGGEIQVLGDRVALVGNAKLDVSGLAGGGTALVGGDFQGNNPDVVNASFTYLGRDAEIKADAVTEGDGGKVILWSDDTTRAYGRISARGGEQGGNGGFVEVSGKQNLEYRALADLRAAAGEAGTLLLDPANLEIVGGSNPDTMGGGDFDGSVFYGSNGPSQVYEADIEAQSLLGNIVLEATDSVWTSGVFDGAVTLATNRNLTIRTRNSVSAGDNPLGIDLSGAAFHTQGTGTINIQAGTAADAHAVMLRAGELSSQGGTISLVSSGDIDVDHVLAGSGNVTLHAGGRVDGGLIQGAFLDVSARSGIYVDTKVNALAASNHGSALYSDINIYNIGALEVRNVRHTGLAGYIEIETAQDPHAAGSPDLLITGAVDAAGGWVDLYSAGAITSSGGMVRGLGLYAEAEKGISLQTQVAHMSLENLDNGSSGIKLVNTGPASIDFMKVTGSGNIEVTNYGALTVYGDAEVYWPSVISQSGSISLTANSPLTIDGNISSYSGAINLRANPSAAGNDNIVVNGNVTTTGITSLLAGGTVTINGSISGPYSVTQHLSAASGRTAASALSTLTAAINNATNSLISSNSTASFTPSEPDEDGSPKPSQTAQNDSGANKNEPARKLYCN